MTKDKMLASLDFAIRQLDTLRGIQNKDLEWVLMRATTAIQHVLDELQNADVSSDGPKTNFEKWKEGLKPEDLIRPRLVDDGCTRCVDIQCIDNCPAENCPAKKSVKGKRANMKRWEHFAQKCDKWFLRWANAPAKEEK